METIDFSVHLSAVEVLLAALLLTLAIVDFTTFRLPNVLNFMLALSGLACAQPHSMATIVDRIVGVGFGGALLSLAALTYRKLRQTSGIGGGDTKLLAAAGAWVSWHGIPTVLMIGASSAAIYGLTLAHVQGRDIRRERVPFGTFLCLGIWTTWFYGPFTL